MREQEAWQTQEEEPTMLTGKGREEEPTWPTGKGRDVQSRMQLHKEGDLVRSALEWITSKHFKRL